jgi:hypothetical protein
MSRPAFLPLPSMLFLLCVLGAVLAASIAAAQQPDAVPNYAEHVQAIFREHCYACHSQDEAKSDLALDSYAAVMRGGASGAVIEPGNPDASRLWKLVNHLEEPHMPPEQDKLPEAQLAILRAWIAGGTLETAGSTPQTKKKPKVDLQTTPVTGRPEGPPVMPEGLSHQPVVAAARGSAVTAMAASPWAPLVAIGSQHQIVLYHTDTGELLGVLPFPEGFPYVLKFSRNGSLLLAGGGRGGKHGLVALYDVKTGARVFEVGDELDAVLAADINNDHSLIALGGPRKIVRIYSAADGTLLHEIKKHTDWIYALEFSPDGVLLATADRNGGMFVWEAETAREYQNLAGHSAAITDLSWRWDSNLLASCSEDGTVRLWEMEGGSQVRNWGAQGGGAWSVEFAYDGRLVTAGRDRQVKVWDQNGSQLKGLDGLTDIGLECVFAHDGQRVVAGDWAGEIRMWNVEDGQVVATLAMNPPALDAQAAQAAAAAAAAEAAAQTAVAEADAAQQAVDALAAALTAAADQLAQAADDAAKTQAQAEIDRLTAEKVAAEQALAAKRTAADTARQRAAAARLRAERLTAELAGTQ